MDAPSPLYDKAFELAVTIALFLMAWVLRGVDSRLSELGRKMDKSTEANARNDERLKFLERDQSKSSHR